MGEHMKHLHPIAVPALSTTLHAVAQVRCAMEGAPCLVYVLCQA